MEDNFNFQDNSGKKKNKGMAILVTILVIIIIAMAGYICYDKGIIFGDSNLKNPNEESEKEKEKDKNSSDDKVGNSNVQEDVVKPLDLTKCLNSSANYSDPSDIPGNYGLAMQINTDKKSVTLTIDWNKFGPLSTASAYAPEVKTYQITGFNKEIKDTFVGGIGQDAMGITLFYIMSDGTVQFTPMFVRKTDTKGNLYFVMNYRNNSDFTVSATAAGVNDVIKLYTANMSTSMGGGGVTTIAAKKDGSFYDLSSEVSKAQGR